MKRRIDVLILAVLVSGCASMEQQAKGMSSYSMCYFAAGGNAQQQAIARQELASRRVSCDPQMVEMGAREVAQTRANNAASSAQMTGIGAAILLNNNPPVSPGINCRSETVGGQTYTNCR